MRKSVPRSKHLMVTDELRFGICDDKEEDLERIRQALQEALQTLRRTVKKRPARQGSRYHARKDS